MVVPVIVGLLASFAVTAFGLRMDTTRPMLQWTHPQEPVKRNLNALIPMALAFGLIGGGAIVATFVRSLGLTGASQYLPRLAIAGGAAYLMYQMLVNGVDRRLSRLEL